MKRQKITIVLKDGEPKPEVEILTAEEFKFKQLPPHKRLLSITQRFTMSSFKGVEKDISNLECVLKALIKEKDQETADIARNNIRILKQIKALQSEFTEIL